MSRRIDVLTSEDLVNAFYEAKTPGSPWCYLSKIRDVLHVSSSELEGLVSDIKAGREPRTVGDYSIVFERDISRYRTYAGSNMMSLMPVR